jgi:hypothetical protein
LAFLLESVGGSSYAAVAAYESGGKGFKRVQGFKGSKAQGFEGFGFEGGGV